MSLATVKMIAKALSQSELANSVDIIWHNGEPLTMPLAFYALAFQQLREHLPNTKITHCVQTNGTLINEQWCDLFLAHKTIVGVSLDGPPHLHNQTRRERDGGGTFTRTMAGIELLRNRRVTFGIMTVLTSDLLDRADDLWEFYVEYGFTNIAFLTEEIHGAHITSTFAHMPFSEHEKRFRQFMTRIVQLNSGAPNIIVREIESARQWIAGGGVALYARESTPLAIVSFDCDGNMGTFSPELLEISHPRYQRFNYGNVGISRISDILDNADFKRTREDIQKGVNNCAAMCDYFAACGGGTPVSKIFENSSFESTETLTCRLRVKATFDIVLDSMTPKES
jgi:uncharacterized protein